MRRRISSAKPGMPALPSKGRQVLRGERWPSGAGGLLTDDLQDGGRAEVGLVEQEVVGADRLQPERFECGGGEVLRVRGDDALRATPDRRREHVPVVLVGQPDSRLEFFPAGDQRVVEGLTHLRGPLARVHAGVDLLGGRLRLGEDPVRPQRAVQALLGHAQAAGTADVHLRRRAADPREYLTHRFRVLVRELDLPRSGCMTCAEPAARIRAPAPAASGASGGSQLRHRHDLSCSGYAVVVA